MAQLKEKLLYIAELDKERCFGDEKEELLEIYGTGDDDCHPCYASDGDGDDNGDDDDDYNGDDVCYPCYAGACTLPAESQAWKRKIFKKENLWNIDYLLEIS